MNAGRVFFDTNILLYMYSDADPRKQARARDLYREYALVRRMWLSTQVVQEFYAAGVRKLALPRKLVRELATALLEAPLVIIRPAHIEAAMENEERHGISFWDALILAAAMSAGAEILYTEDMNDGQ